MLASIFIPSIPLSLRYVNLEGSQHKNVVQCDRCVPTIFKFWPWLISQCEHRVRVRCAQNLTASLKLRPPSSPVENHCSIARHCDLSTRTNVTLRPNEIEVKFVYKVTTGRRVTQDDRSHLPKCQDCRHLLSAHLPDRIARFFPSQQSWCRLGTYRRHVLYRVTLLFYYLFKPVNRPL